MIRVFISVAGNLLQMSDFHGAHCIIQGLEHPLIRQLERSWEVCLGTRFGGIPLDVTNKNLSGYWLLLPSSVQDAEGVHE